MPRRFRAVGLCLALLIVASACEGQASIAYPSAPASASPGSWTFDGDAAGGVPAGAEVFSGSWVVRAEADAPSKPNALCQVGDTEFPAIALGSSVYGDLTVSLRFKPISGKVDQAAGIIFRVQDRDDYYIIRANVLESNVNFYKYAGARRSGIKDGGAKVAVGQWQELRLEVSGDRPGLPEPSARRRSDGQHIHSRSHRTVDEGGLGDMLRRRGRDTRDQVTVAASAFIEELVTEIRFDSDTIELVIRPELRRMVAALASPAIAVYVSAA